ncbi:MAG: hypothetical protein KJ600_00945 [Nanoarchaeota archaeon]|nr:hypothetical protein [Nanoarchaeota archaeon]MBU1103108.1 hypothetical protein [Nanoarchaeota archaeon]
MIVKILGGIDFAAALAFLMLIFGMDVLPQYLLFCAGLLFLKGMFLFLGDVLSAVDIFSAILLILSVSFTLPSILLWIPAFLLVAKGVVSFV